MINPLGSPGGFYFYTEEEAEAWMVLNAKAAYGEDGRALSIYASFLNA